MDAKSDAKKTYVAQRYLTLPEQVRNEVKNNVMTNLGNPLQQARSTSALVLGKIAAIELPRDMWPNLMEMVLTSLTTNQQNTFLRQSTFESLGYICEECPEKLAPHSVAILNAISTGLAAEETDNGIKLAAIRALTNSLECIKTNFTNPEHRDIIMQMVFSAAGGNDLGVRLHSYYCLVAIAQKYYTYLNSYMAFIFQMTSHAIQQTDSEEIAMQGVEFWTTISEKESDIKQLAYEAQQRNQQPPEPLHNFMATALKDIMPLLLLSLTKQSEELDDETFNLAKAAAICIGNAAEATADACIDHVLPFVKENIRHPNWRFREAATLAFGYILDGPDRAKMTETVQEAFQLLLSHMSDENDIVKDTTAWTLGRICNLFAEEVVNAHTLPILIQVFHAGLKTEPCIARNICWAIHNLAAAVTLTEESQTSPLSQYFQDLVSALLGLSEQVDEPKLVDSAFVAITQLILNSAPDCAPLLGT